VFVSKKKHKVEVLVFDYLELASRCLDCCKQNFEEFYTKNRADDNFWSRIKEVHSYESKSDDRRKDIEFLMYQKSLIPESRGDILGLLEVVDKIPNTAESVLREIYQTDMTLPEEYRPGFKELFEINLEAAKLAVKITCKYFEDPREIESLHRKIDDLESASDIKQISMTRKVFLSSTSEFQKIMLQNLISKIGQMSDYAEDLGDRVKILSVKTVF